MNKNSIQFYTTDIFGDLEILYLRLGIHMVTWQNISEKGLKGQGKNEWLWHLMSKYSVCIKGYTFDILNTGSFLRKTAKPDKVPM